MKTEDKLSLLQGWLLSAVMQMPYITIIINQSAGETTEGVQGDQ